MLESAFGWRGEGAEDNRRIFAGVNWSAAIKNPFRSFGTTGEGLEAALTDMKAGADEPVVFVLHLPTRGLSTSTAARAPWWSGVRLMIDASDILGVTKAVTKEWTSQRKAEERGNRSRSSRAYVYSDRVNFTDVADGILPDAYMHASGGGKYTVTSGSSTMRAASNSRGGPAVSWRPTTFQTRCCGSISIAIAQHRVVEDDGRSARNTDDSRRSHQGPHPVRHAPIEGHLARPLVR